MHDVRGVPVLFWTWCRPYRSVIFVRRRTGYKHFMKIRSQLCVRRNSADRNTQTNKQTVKKTQTPLAEVISRKITRL